jgi:hypothetical protein
LSSPAESTIVQKSGSTIKISLLLSAPSAGMIWKIPLLRNPNTEKPFRMNLTLWGYATGATKGNK